MGDNAVIQYGRQITWSNFEPVLCFFKRFFFIFIYWSKTASTKAQKEEKDTALPTMDPALPVSQMFALFHLVSSFNVSDIVSSTHKKVCITTFYLNCTMQCNADVCSASITV